MEVYQNQKNFKVGRAFLFLFFKLSLAAQSTYWKDLVYPQEIPEAKVSHVS